MTNFQWPKPKDDDPALHMTESRTRMYKMSDGTFNLFTQITGIIDQHGDGYYVLVLSGKSYKLFVVQWYRECCSSLFYAGTWKWALSGMCLVRWWKLFCLVPRQVQGYSHWPELHRVSTVLLDQLDQELISYHYSSCWCVVLLVLVGTTIFKIA